MYGTKIVWVAILLVTSLIAYILPDELQCFNILLEVVGRWDVLMDRCQASKLSIPSDSSTYTLLLSRIGFLHTQMRDYDDALAIYTEEVIPRVKDKGDTLDLATTLGKISQLYRTKTQYQKGLENLIEARELLLARGISIMTSLQLSETEEGIKELEYLVNAVEDQEAYISALVWLAQRYRFSIASDEATSIRCPIRNSKRFPILLDFWFYIAIGNVVWCSIYLLRKPPKQYYMKRRILVCTISLPVLSSIMTLWSWSVAPTVEKLISVASIASIMGQYETALQFYDEARCEILANPYEETILTQAAGLEAFTGAVLVYTSLGLYDRVDTLADAINNLIDVNEILEPNMVVAAFYFNLNIAYSHQEREQLAESYHSLAEREIENMIHTTEEEINSLLTRTSVTVQRRGENITSGIEKVLDRSYYEL